jgi:hypothetical protein
VNRKEILVAPRVEQTLLELAVHESPEPCAVLRVGIQCREELLVPSVGQQAGNLSPKKELRKRSQPWVGSSGFQVVGT